MKRNLFLIFHGRFPSEKAAALFAAKSAEAFSAVGYAVTVLVPDRDVPNEDPYAAYGIPHTFEVARLPCANLFKVPLPRTAAFWGTYLSFSWSVASYLKRHAPQESIIYSNELVSLWMARPFPNTFYELHDFPESKVSMFARIVRSFAGVIVHNQWKMKTLAAIIPESHERMLYESNAVDIAAFHTGISKEEARAKVGLPLDAKILMYTGHLYGWKGVDTLAAAAPLLPEDYLVVLVGGTPEDVSAFTARHNSQRLLIIGHRPHAEMPFWQAAADVLVLPNTAQERISALYTSPMKLYEYMASGRPIVASDLPSIREVVSEKEVVFVAPDDAAALAAGLVAAVQDEKRGVERSQNAFAAVASHTWVKRAERIRVFIEAHSKN